MRLLPQPETVRAPLASQPTLGRLKVGIMRTLADDDGSYAVLLVRGPDLSRQETVRAGRYVDLPGHGRLTVDRVLPATAEQRGWVQLTLQP